MISQAFSLSKTQFSKESIKQSVFKATVETESGKVDEVALLEITSLLNEKQELMAHVVAIILERIRNQSPSTSCMAMIFLAELMQRSGYEMHRLVLKNILPVMMKVAVPRSGVHPRVQTVASSVIKAWGIAYGTDHRLIDFADAAR